MVILDVLERMSFSDLKKRKVNRIERNRHGNQQEKFGYFSKFYSFAGMNKKYSSIRAKAVG